MGKFRKIQNSFLGGQISGTATGRTDLPQYQHSCEILQNMIPMLSGGAYRRPGTLFQAALTAYNAGTTTTGDRPPRIIEFIVSRNEAYALMLGCNGSGPTGYIQSYRATGNATGQVQPGAVSGTTPYLPNTGTPNNLGNFDDDVWAVQYAQSNDVMWLVHPNYKPKAVQRTGRDAFSVVDFDAVSAITSAPNPGLARAQAYPYLPQNATTNTMAISTTTVGTLRTLICSAGYFVPAHIGSIFAIQSGTDVTASGGVGYALITAVGSLTDGVATQATATVLSAFEDTSAHTTWWESAWSDYRGWPRSVCIFQQRLCMSGAVPVLGESVDAFGIPAGRPDTISCSETGNYSKFTALGDVITINGSPATVNTITGTLANGQNYTQAGNFVYYPTDDSAGDGQGTGPLGIQPFSVTLADSQLDSIQWMSADQEILIGTLSEEWVLAPQNGAFDVANSIATIQSHYGSDFIPAQRIGYELMFVTRQQSECLAYQYNYIDASFFGEPVQLFFDEYPMAELNTLSTGRRKFRQMTWDVTRKTLWCVDTAGNLFGMTRDRKLQVTMWHTHQLGGYNPAQGVLVGQGSNADPAWALCDGSVVSFASVPNPFCGMNDIWMVVKRTIAGAVQWQLERMIGGNTVRTSAYQAVFPGTQSTEPFLVDAAVVLEDNGDGSVDYNVGTQLNGYTLTGTYYSQLWGLFQISSAGAVAGGVANLQQPLPPDYGSNVGGAAHFFTLGLPYTSVIKPVRPDIPSQVGTGQDSIKRVAKAFIRFYRTLMANCGAAPGAATSPISVVPWTPSAQMAQSPEIFTGDKQVFVATQYDRDGYIYITQTSPLPFTVVSFVVEGASYDQ